LTGAYAKITAFSKLSLFNIALIQRHIKQATYLGCGASRNEKKFDEVFIGAPIKAFSDIVHY
jgi:hypothetical protein